MKLSVKKKSSADPNMTDHEQAASRQYSASGSTAQRKTNPNETSNNQMSNSQAGQRGGVSGLYGQNET